VTCFLEAALELAGPKAKNKPTLKAIKTITAINLFITKIPPFNEFYDII